MNRAMGLFLLGALLFSSMAAAATSAPTTLGPPGTPDDTTRAKVLVLLDQSRSLDRIRTVRASIEASGGRVRAVLGLAGIVAEVEAGSVPGLAAMAGVQGVYESGLAAPPFQDAQTVAAVAAWNRLLGPPPPPTPERPGAPETDAYPAPDLPSSDSAREQIETEYDHLEQTLGGGCPSNGAGFFDTSMYLAGDIAVGIFYTTTGWTPALTASEFAAVVFSLDKLLDAHTYARLAFTYVSEVDNSGNPLPAPTNERLYDNNLRTTWCTDWAYVIEIRNDGTWPNAYLNGPSMRLDLSWSPYFIVARHETGHVFGALDQYCPNAPSARYGYVMAAHANACGNDGNGYFSGAGENLPDLMSGWDACYGYNDLISVFTAGQFGWYDHNGDGILDVMETQPVINGGTVSHTATNPPVYGGTSFDSPLLTESFGGSASINRVTGVQYRLDAMPWQEATPADGNFDSASEGFQFTTPSLPNGTYQLQIRARNTIGRTTVLPYTETLVITGSTTTNTRPYGVLSVTPKRAKFGTTVVASGVGSRDVETATSLLQYSWRWGDGPPFSAYNTIPTASHTYAAPGTYLVEMRVRDASGAFHLLSQTVVAEAYDTAPVITFRATPEERHYNASSNYPASLSVYGTTDGETPYTALETRWDLDGNGTWDTSWSTSKTWIGTLSGLQLNFPTSCAASLIYPRSDRRRIRVQVADGPGGTGNLSTAERVIWVVPYNHRPTFPLFNAVTFVGLNATAHASDVDNTTTWDSVLEYRWDVNDDGIWDTPFTSSPTQLLTSTTSFRVEAQDRFEARAGYSPWIWKVVEASPSYLKVGLPMSMGFDVGNVGDVTGPLSYRVSVQGPDMKPDSTTVRLNGLPPGTPVDGLLHTPIDESGSASVEVEFIREVPGKPYYLVVTGDQNHDGDPSEPMVSFEMRSDPAITVSAPDDGALPAQAALAQNRPNPFLSSTTIRFALPTAATARLEVLDLQGRSIRTLAEGRFAAGDHQVTWDRRDRRGRTVAAGVYMYALRTDDHATALRKVVVLP